MSVICKHACRRNEDITAAIRNHTKACVARLDSLRRQKFCGLILGITAHQRCQFPLLSCMSTNHSASRLLRAPAVAYNSAVPVFTEPRKFNIQQVGAISGGIKFKYESMNVSRGATQTRSQDWIGGTTSIMQDLWYHVNSGSCFKFEHWTLSIDMSFGRFYLESAGGTKILNYSGICLTK